MSRVSFHEIPVNPGRRGVIMESWPVGLTFAATLGSGLIAGVFFAFSSFVMAALRRRPAAEGMAAMQAINIAAINPAFLGVFLGTAAAGAVLGGFAVMRWSRPGAAYLLAGAGLYCVGTFLVTMLFNVPLNNALAKATPGEASAEQLWIRYATRWTLWNHVRTAAAAAAMTLFAMALRQ